MTSQATTALSAVPRLGPSREELAELEREVELYLTFWAHARAGGGTRSEQDAR